MTQKNRVFGTSLVGGYGVGIKMEAYITVLVTHRRSQEDYDPSSVSGIRNATTTEAARYTLDGRQVTAPQHGLNIIRLSDGTVKKIMVK